MQPRSPVIVFGTGEFAEVAAYYLAKDGNYDVSAFTVDRNHMDSQSMQGKPIVAFEDIEKHFPPTKYKMFIAVGFSQQNATRALKYDQAKSKGYELITYVCSKAIVWDNVELGDNCFVFEANVIQPFVKIGNDVIIWSGNHIGHHTTIADHCFIASHAVISGKVKIQQSCFIGVNATIRDGITIAKGCVIGAGALIIKDTEPNCVYGGTPANLLRRLA
ncbi:MAG: acetyltransferase [Thaumarchaeota archaeon]|nr:acetyltransferase [Nitrososphaerota archaeon]